MDNGMWVMACDSAEGVDDGGRRQAVDKKVLTTETAGMVKMMGLRTS